MGSGQVVVGSGRDRLGYQIVPQDTFIEFFTKAEACSGAKSLSRSGVLWHLFLLFIVRLSNLAVADLVLLPYKSCFSGKIDEGDPSISRGCGWWQNAKLTVRRLLCIVNPRFTVAPLTEGL
jgi:hypothetical protein